MYSAWGDWAKENNKDLIPFTTPEFDGRYVTWGDPSSIPLERSTTKFLERLNITFRYLPRTKIVMIGTFNDFFESTTLEPTREYGFSTLQVIQEVLEEYMEKQEKD